MKLVIATHATASLWVLGQTVRIPLSNHEWYSCEFDKAWTIFMSHVGLPSAAACVATRIFLGWFAFRLTEIKLQLDERGTAALSRKMKRFIDRRHWVTVRRECVVFSPSFCCCFRRSTSLEFLHLSYCSILFFGCLSISAFRHKHAMRMAFGTRKSPTSRPYCAFLVSSLAFLFQ